MSVVVCDECKNEFYLNPVSIQERKVNNQNLSLIFFTCPECNKIYCVFLKDERYEELREDLEKAKARLRRNNGRNDVEFQRTLQSIVLRKAERLSNYTRQLNDKFKGTFTFDASGNNVEEQNIIYLP